jgi:predicted porin
MQKKLIAVAVAGALGAPVLAHAQASTVQVYGNLYYEYTWMDQGRAPVGGDRIDVDMMQTPGSEIGFKGEEQLGGGLSAWFQCASTADMRGQSQDGWCSRNSALGFKGAFGNVFMGNWDTPFKRVGGVNRIVNETGAFGASFLLTGGATTVNGGETVGLFSRRQNNTVNYDSPNFGGFQLMASVSALNTATSNLDSAAGNKPRLWSLGATYRNGPLNVGAAYEQHNEFQSSQTPRFEGDDKGWVLAAGYQLGPVRLGAIYTQQKFEPAPGADLKVKAWHLAADWKFAGPHGLRAGYTQADDNGGNFTGTIAGSGSRRVGGADTGAKLYQIHYVNTISKRTEATIGYAKLKNDNRANYSLGGLSAPAAGEDQDVFGFSIRHRF